MFGCDEHESGQSDKRTLLRSAFGAVSMPQTTRVYSASSAVTTKPCACINHQPSYRPVIACKVHFTTSSSCALVDGSPSLLTLPSDTTSFARMPVGLILVVMPDKNERNVALLEPTICQNCVPTSACGKSKLTSKSFRAIEQALFSRVDWLGDSRE